MNAILGLKLLAKTAIRFVNVKSPAILMGAGTVLFVVTVAEAIKDSSSVEKIESEEKHIDEAVSAVRSNSDKANDTEASQKRNSIADIIGNCLHKSGIWVRSRVRAYWKTFSLGFLALLCFFTAQHITAKRLATATAALVAASSKNSTVERKARELFGDDKAKELSEAVAADSTNTSKMCLSGACNTYIDGPTGEILIRPHVELVASINALNESLLTDMVGNSCDGDVFYTLNTIRRYLGLKPADAYDAIGRSFKLDGLLHPEYVPTKLADGSPAYRIDYKVYPISDNQYSWDTIQEGRKRNMLRL